MGTIGTVITDTGNWENGDYPGSAAIRGDGCFDGPCEVPNLAGIESATDAATNTGYTTSFTSTGGELGFTTYWQMCKGERGPRRPARHASLYDGRRRRVCLCHPRCGRSLGDGRADGVVLGSPGKHVIRG